MFNALGLRFKLAKEAWKSALFTHTPDHKQSLLNLLLNSISPAIRAPKKHMILPSFETLRHFVLTTFTVKNSTSMIWRLLVESHYLYCPIAWIIALKFRNL